MSPRADAVRPPLAVALALSVLGCAVGPNYKRPDAAVPPAWKESGPPEETATGADWKPARPSDDAQRGKWWQVFGDAELNALEEQIATANQNVAQADARYRAARAAIRGVRADQFPQVTASASATRSRSTNRTVSGAAPVTTTTYQVGGDVSWELDLWGRVRRSVEASVATAQATQADLENVRLSLQAELAIDWFQLHGLDAEKLLLDKSVSADEKALKLTTNRHDQGVVSGVDVAQAQTQLETTRVQAIDVQIERAQLEHAIAILIGKPPAELTIPSAPIGVRPPPVPAGLPSDLLERRPDIAGAERRVAAANAQIGVATAAWFPQLGLGATAGWQSSTLSTLFSAPAFFWSVGPALAATLFDAGKRRSATEQARASWEAAVAGYRESVLEAFQQVEDSLAALRILAQEAVQQAAAVASAEHSLSLAQNRYEGGITTYLEVVTAQGVALANERAAVQLLTRRMAAAVGLVKALGGGWGEASPR